MLVEPVDALFECTDTLSEAICNENATDKDPSPA